MKWYYNKYYDLLRDLTEKLNILDERDNIFYQKLEKVEWHNLQRIYDSWMIDLIKILLNKYK